MRWLGALVLTGTAVHAAYHLRHGRPWDLLWMCHVGSLLVGLGLLFRWPQAMGIGVLWLAAGLPFWLLDLATGGEFMPTSLFTHVGGLIAGIVGVIKLGMPAGGWWKAVLALAALHQACRWLTPATANVNLAFSVHPGWERWFPSYRWYYATLLVTLAAAFFGIERGLRRICADPSA